MQYQIDFFEALYVMMIDEHMYLSIFYIYLYCILPVIMFHCMPNRKAKIIVTIICAVLYGSSLSVWGSGWRIEGDIFHIRSFMFSNDVDIKKMEIGFIDYNSAWSPGWRKNAAGNPGLGAGLYGLKNAKEAIVFNHYYQWNLLLISSEGKYYLIGHPGIKSLYDELIRLGAQPKDFEN